MESLVADLETFRGRRVLVTGHTGFKGSWLSLWLQQHGAIVYGFALQPESAKSHFSLLNLDQIIEHNVGDIRNEESLRQIFDRVKPEVVFHLAAQPLVKKSYDFPVETFDTNIIGSTHLLECVRNSPSVKVCIFVTSDKCYLNRETSIGYKENDQLGGHDPYSASKAAAELVFASYNFSFFNNNELLGAASVRAGNVIGGGDWSDNRIVPDCVRALIDGRPIVLRQPYATRPWQHVLEPLSGYIKLAAKLFRQPNFGISSFNVGPLESSVHTVLDVAQACVKEWGSGDVVVDSLEANHHEASILHLNCDLAKTELLWEPRWNFSQTVHETMDWYKRAEGHEPVIEITGQQIKKYEESLND